MLHHEGHIVETIVSQSWWLLIPTGVVGAWHWLMRKVRP